MHDDLTIKHNRVSNINIKFSLDNLYFPTKKDIRNIMKTNKNYKPMTTVKVRSLEAIALEIKSIWKQPYFGAVPYLNAMLRLDKITDNYGLEDGVSIVSYFLSNATMWRGEDARRIKKELNNMLK